MISACLNKKGSFFLRSISSVLSSFPPAGNIDSLFFLCKVDNPFFCSDLAQPALAMMNMILHTMFLHVFLMWSGGHAEIIARDASAVELPNVKLVDCLEVPLTGFDKCLMIKFSYLEEYAGLNEVDGSSDILVGQLYGTDGTCNEDSRVSVSIDGAFYFVR